MQDLGAQIDQRVKKLIRIGCGKMRCFGDGNGIGTLPTEAKTDGKTGNCKSGGTEIGIEIHDEELRKERQKSGTIIALPRNEGMFDYGGSEVKTAKGWDRARAVGGLLLRIIFNHEGMKNKLATNEHE